MFVLASLALLASFMLSVQAGPVFRRESGTATFFYQGGVAGACGTVHSDSASIVALPPSLWGDTNSVSSLCGSSVQITRTSTGDSVTATVADLCPSCSDSIDLSVGAFTSIATEDEGEVAVTWTIS